MITNILRRLESTVSMTTIQAAQKGWNNLRLHLELISCWLSSRLNTTINNIILTQLSPSNTPQHSATATGSRRTRRVLTLQPFIRVYDTHTLARTNTHTTRSVCFPQPRSLSALRRRCCRSLFLNIQPFDFREMFPADSADSLLSLSRTNIVQTCSGVLLEESLDHVAEWWLHKSSLSQHQGACSTFCRLV